MDYTFRIESFRSAKALRENRSNIDGILTVALAVKVALISLLIF